MAGGHAPTEEELGLKGWHKTFNTFTLRGRLNTAYASIAFWSGIFVLYKLNSYRKSNVKGIESKK